MSTNPEQHSIQIITYIRRRRDLTREQFYDHWENVHGPKVAPWAKRHGIIRYQQVHASGSMVPVAASASAPNALSTGELPDTPVEFDGIAMFLVPSLQQFMEAFKDPYYIDIIEPDERMMIDKAGPGSGLIASFRGKMLEMESKADVSKGDEYRKKFEEYEKKAKTES